ncbi:MAG: cytochrome c [Bdellovibrionales bacterium]|nr:cytochrome c [Bdellovibrionales bacterium]
MKLGSLFMIYSFFALLGCQAKRPAMTPEASVQFLYQTQSISLGPLKNKTWQSFTQVDGISGAQLSYGGYSIEALIQLARSQWNFRGKAIRFTARDGYVVNYSLDDLLKARAFLALEVAGTSTKGIYNPELKTHFDWRPGYLVFRDSKMSAGKSSPYQIISLELLDQTPTQEFLAKVPDHLKNGAKVYLKTCNKCHSYQGLGGSKAPPINFMTIKRKNNSDLKRFLRAPQDVAKRRFEMSPFTGSDQDLDKLLKFLRSLEPKPANP